MYKHHSNQLPSIFSTYFTKHVQTHNNSTRNAQDYSIIKTKQMFSDCAIRNCGSNSFWNSLDKTVKQCKSTKHFQNSWNQFYYLNTIDFILGNVLCVLVYFCYVCVKRVFLQVSVYLLKFLLGHDCLRPFWPFDHVLNIMLCFMLLFCFWFVWYWNEVWYDWCVPTMSEVINVSI